MSKRLWVVTISEEIVVLADDAAEAIDEASEAMRSGHVDPEPESAVEMSWLPGGWDLGCIPFGTEGDQTLGDAIASGAAPKYTAARERLRKREP